MQSSQFWTDHLLLNDIFTEDKKAIINGMTATDISVYCDMSGPVEEGR